MDMVWRGRDDGKCTQCIFCDVADKQLLAPCLPAGLLPVAEWPERYVFPSCAACQQEAQAHGETLVSAQRATGAISIEPGARVHNAMCAMAGRLAKAMFYDQQGVIFPDFGAIYCYWEAANAPPIAGFSVEAELDQWGERETVVSGSPHLDRVLRLVVAPSTCAVALHAEVAQTFRLLVFADVSPDTLAASTHELYDLLPGGLHQVQAGLYE